jgi:osmotically-inducible protein OsmY
MKWHYWRRLENFPAALAAVILIAAGGLQAAPALAIPAKLQSGDRSAKAGSEIPGTATQSQRLNPSSQTVAARVPGRSDEQLQRLVRRLLQDDPRTRPFARRATVQNGRATLVGHTFNGKDRELAKSTAARVPGVVAVDNLIVVEPNADLEIARKLHDAFAQDPLVDDAAIGVTVISGKVFLSGAPVASDQLERINAIAFSVPGVLSVSNGLQLAPASKGRLIRPVMTRSYPSVRR